MKVHLFWLRITDEGSVSDTRIWFILLIKSDLKWCVHLSKRMFLYLNNCIDGNAALNTALLNIQIIAFQFQSLQDGWTPLHTACYYGHSLVVSLLLKESADVNIQEKVSNICDSDH